MTLDTQIQADLKSGLSSAIVDAKAKDISILFADYSTGSHSPSLVRQGQITEIVNANPKSRRRLWRRQPVSLDCIKGDMRLS